MKIIALPDSSVDCSGLPFLPLLAYPDSVMVRSGNPVFLPEFDSSFSGSLFLGVKISRLGKSIAARFASRYYSEAAPVLAVRPDNLIPLLASRGLPWTAAACFDRSIVVGDYRECRQLRERRLVVSYSGHPDISATLPAEEDIAKAIAEVSRNNALKMGDIILIPLEIPSIPLHLDSSLSVTAGEELLLKTVIK